MRVIILYGSWRLYCIVLRGSGYTTKDHYKINTALEAGNITSCQYHVHVQLGLLVFGGS